MRTRYPCTCNIIIIVIILFIIYRPVRGAREGSRPAARRTAQRAPTIIRLHGGLTRARNRKPRGGRVTVAGPTLRFIFKRNNNDNNAPFREETKIHEKPLMHFLRPTKTVNRDRSSSPVKPLEQHLVGRL